MLLTLASLRRQGSPYQLSPTQLYQELLITSGAITYRLDRLEEMEFIKRISDPEDRRGRLVQLTHMGQDLIDHLLENRLKKEKTLLDPFSEKEGNDMSQGLATLLINFETDTDKIAC